VWQDGAPAEEEAGIEVDPFWGGGEEKAHRRWCSTRVRLDRWQHAGVEVEDGYGQIGKEAILGWCR
jgi:hypothetical protein